MKLTPLQQEALRQVCRTNGGGVYVRCTTKNDVVVPQERVMAALFAKGLIQGKAGSYSTVVHTKEGLALHRSLEERTK